MQKLLITLFLVSIVTSCTPKNINQYQCQADLQNKAITPKDPGLNIGHSHFSHLEIPSDIMMPENVKESNYPIILYGQKDVAIIILHGFIASPFEPSALGKILNKEGYTVYIPLIDGFGGSTQLANTSDYQNWKLTIKQSIELLSPCFKKFVLIGFSLGGTIISDYMLNQDMQENYQIESIVLLAPFYKPKLWGGSAANAFVNIFTDSISLDTLYKGSRNPDLLIPLSNPDYYNSDMPLNAVKQLYAFSDEMTSLDNAVASDIPTFLVVTEDDETVDNEYSQYFITKHFPNNEIFQFIKKDKARHQFLIPEGNIHFKTLADKISFFIKQNRKSKSFAKP